MPEPAADPTPNSIVTLHLAKDLSVFEHATLKLHRYNLNAKPTTPNSRGSRLYRYRYNPNPTHGNRSPSPSLDCPHGAAHTP